MIRKTATVEFGPVQKRVDLVDLEDKTLESKSSIANFGIDAAGNGPSKIWVVSYLPPTSWFKQKAVIAGGFRTLLRFVHQGRLRLPLALQLVVDLGDDRGDVREAVGGEALRGGGEVPRRIKQAGDRVPHLWTVHFEFGALQTCGNLAVLEY